MSLVVREFYPDERAKGRLRGEETIDFHESTERPRIPVIQGHGEIIEIRKNAIPKQRCAQRRMGLRLETRKRFRKILNRNAEHPAQSDEVPALKIGFFSAKPQRHGLPTYADTSSQFSASPAPSLEQCL